MEDQEAKAIVFLGTNIMGWRYEHGSFWGPDAVIQWNPLHNDTDAMAIVDKFDGMRYSVRKHPLGDIMTVGLYTASNETWHFSSQYHAKPEDRAALRRRAICEVALAKIGIIGTRMLGIEKIDGR